MFDSILIICTGNICRSPYGEAKLKSIMSNKRITSAGVATEKSQLEGCPAEPLALKVALNLGLDLSQHRAKQVTQQLVEDYELILAMEPSQIERLCRLYPVARHKAFLFGHWIGLSTIKDPYQEDEHAFQQVFANIDRASESWVRKLIRFT